MKTKLSVLVLFSMVCLNGFSQGGGNPLVDKSQGVFKVKTKVEMAAMEAKLNLKGKAAFDKAKNDFKNVRNAKFEIAPNEQLNQDPKELLGISEKEKPDLKLSERQNAENRKNEKAIKDNLTAVGIDVSGLDFSYSRPVPNQALLDSWNTNILTPVKNQGGCGSCWAFAAAAAFEHAYFKFYKVSTDISEQDLVACGVTSDGVDCGNCIYGGHSYRAFSYMASKGVTREKDFPYTGSDGPCMVKPKYSGIYSWGVYYPGRFPTVNEIKNGITYYGSVVTYLKAGLSTFYSYGGGVYNGFPSNSNNDIDHAVIIVGWNEAMKAWIIKNSWGTNWGPYGGYAYVGYDQCNIGKYVYWVMPKR
jgi:C1A family cysteine protease